MSTIKNISLFLVVSTLLTVLATCLKSNFIFAYLQNNIIGLLLTLLAINTATLGLIASKIHDTIKEYPTLDFGKTIKEMKLSVAEQIVLISLSLITLLLIKSEVITFVYKEFIGNLFLTAILLYSINILWDTGKAVFVLIDQIQNLKKKPPPSP